ncbi:MAG: hypothetical protein MJ174_00615 [Treponema sp.]|nr:hypothetical protein [Treponema sp.]
MKKLFAVLFVAAVMVAGLFADDSAFPTGTWVDSKYNAEWVIKADGNITLKDAKTHNTIWVFKKDKVQNYNISVGLDGAKITFYCPATSRAYEFKKDLSLSADLVLTINPDWTDEDYQTSIKFKDAKVF